MFARFFSNILVDWYIDLLDYFCFVDEANMIPDEYFIAIELQNGQSIYFKLFG